MTDNPYQSPQSSSPPRGSSWLNLLAWIPVFLLASLLVYTLRTRFRLQVLYSELEFSPPIFSKVVLSGWMVAVEVLFLLLAVLAASLVRQRGLRIASQLGLYLVFLVLTAAYVIEAYLPMIGIVRALE